MIGNETLGKSKYFELIKGKHRGKKTNKIHYSVKTQRRFYLEYEDDLTDDDLSRIKKIADPNRNINPSQRKFEWNYNNYERAHSIFMMLILNGY